MCAHEKQACWERGFTLFSHLTMHLEMLNCELNRNLNMIKLLVHMDPAKQNCEVCFFSFKGSELKKKKIMNRNTYLETTSPKEILC